MASATPIDFSGTSLSKHYSNFFAKILDNVFTPSECASLIALASSSDDWKPAGMGTEPPHEATSSRFRQSERILRVDAQTADMIYERLRPLVDEIHEIPPGGKWECVTVRPGKKQGPTWKMVGSVNNSTHSLDRAKLRGNQPQNQPPFKFLALWPRPLFQATLRRSSRTPQWKPPPKVVCHASSVP